MCPTTDKLLIELYYNAFREEDEDVTETEIIK